MKDPLSLTKIIQGVTVKAAELDVLVADYIRVGSPSFFILIQKITGIKEKEKDLSVFFFFFFEW
jgi:hypothetical protein